MTQVEPAELKPCPFCGNDPLFEEPTPNLIENQPPEIEGDVVKEGEAHGLER